MSPVGCWPSSEANPSHLPRTEVSRALGLSAFNPGKSWEDEGVPVSIPPTPSSDPSGRLEEDTVFPSWHGGTQAQPHGAPGRSLWNRILGLVMSESGSPWVEPSHKQYPRGHRALAVHPHGRIIGLKKARALSNPSLIMWPRPNSSVPRETKSLFPRKVLTRH